MYRSWDSILLFLPIYQVNLLLSLGTCGINHVLTLPERYRATPVPQVAPFATSYLCPSLVILICFLFSKYHLVQPLTQDGPGLTSTGSASQSLLYCLS